MLFSVGVIALLIGLLITGLRAASSMSRSAEQTMAVKTIDTAVQSFRSDHGFLPPLVQDNAPGAPTFAVPQDARVGPLFGTGSQPKQPVTFLSSTHPLRWTREHRYLRGRNPDTEGERLTGADRRFSEYSLAYYLVGALGEEPGNPSRLVDGVEGPGFMQVNEDGTFKRSGRRFGALIDPNKGMGGVQVVNAAEGRVTLRDRFGTPYRYYRWERGREYTAGSGNYEVRESFDLGVPRLLSGEDDANTNPAVLTELLNANTDLKSAGYVILGAGANRTFGDKDTEGIDAIRAALGSSASEEKLLRAARRDNVMGVGR